MKQTAPENFFKRLRKAEHMKRSTDDMSQFHSVDQTVNPTYFIKFVNAANELPSVRSYKREMMDCLAPSDGEAILDVGCGAGQGTLDMARAVGPRGRVVGIDRSGAMLEEARTRAAHNQLSVEYILADAMKLPFADASFDGCLASSILEHLPEPSLALAEMVRVARPGGRIVVSDGDTDLTAVEISDCALARKIIHAACDQISQGWMGRQLPRLFKQANLHDIKVTSRLMLTDYAFFCTLFGGLLKGAQAAGTISSEELTRFWNELEQAEQEQLFFAGVGGVIVSGRK
jgi:ubiquinone/menaquinone biosynthesis C-methylase UbiE